MTSEKMVESLEIRTVGNKKKSVTVYFDNIFLNLSIFFYEEPIKWKNHRNLILEKNEGYFFVFPSTEKRDQIMRKFNASYLITICETWK